MRSTTDLYSLSKWITSKTNICALLNTKMLDLKLNIFHTKKKTEFMTPHKRPTNRSIFKNVYKIYKHIIKY